ncbi:PSD1 and planctomycete cytochrome C domain-containing protein [Horticoccus sp. 23ND18S-11]|uniref:PSD1 and planctomycete cytochrome C domain-containing protein n=1 Tax=Horticoccus sp. 23ND18S-11 TaxID=3391832 RepID=UPI0039C9E9AC
MIRVRARRSGLCIGRKIGVEFGVRLPRSLPLLALLCGLPLGTFASDAEVLFVRRIQPLLTDKCLACHGNDEAKIKGGLDLRTSAGMLAGGDNGIVVHPGKAAESPLLLAVQRESDEFEPMPPKEPDRLSAEQIEWLHTWIAAGAPWPDAAKQKEIAAAHAQAWEAEDGIVIKTSGGLSEDWTHRRYKPEGMWAYQPVRKPAVPSVAQSDHPIDAFIAHKLPAGLAPAPAADARTFIRRATFDLTGLPPTPEDVAAFEADSIRNPESALRNLVDRLLASPHYGERMAQHWLDVTRYADSSGFANDFERGNAWRYRDYVVRAFNADKPYDRFVREQIAGDELADSSAPATLHAEGLIATGFLRMGPWELTGMEVAKVARQRFLDDVTNSVGETFLAQSLQCARCHDHKFDPVPTRDYYSLQATFATTQLAERPAAFLPEENVAGFEEKKYLEPRREDYLTTLRRLDVQLLASAEKWFQEKGLDPGKWNAAVAQARTQERGGKRREFEGVFNLARAALTRQKVPEDQFPPKLVGFSPEDYGNERVARKGLERLKWELDRYEPVALAVYNGRTPELKAVLNPLRMPANRMTEGELEQTCILTYGDPFALGEKVSPGVLSAIGVAPKTPVPDTIEGRRSALAAWVASAENPLTTRAIVNRVWLWHFGQPLAGNPNNFGSTGKKPTHPELLDWLAATFVEQGWSFKQLHRVIMTSAAYRRGSLHPDRTLLAATDPAGTSYAAFAPRRLTAEELRDAMLSATGELNRTLGGIPNRPEMNLEAALQPRQVMGTFASAWIPNPLPAQRHRRSLYALKIRGLPDPAFEVFNQPAPDFSCERRDASTITPQVFSLFNSAASHARALALAARAIAETKTDDAAVARVFALALARAPTAAELTACLKHWQSITALIAADVPAKSALPLEVRRDAVEENTGEKFAFQEKLHAYADFVPDLQPADVPLRTRAFADVCLALFNANEFSYVD